MEWVYQEDYLAASGLRQDYTDGLSRLLAERRIAVQAQRDRYAAGILGHEEEARADFIRMLG